MRSYAYSFLDNLPVPEDISCLIASLKALNSLLVQRAQAAGGLAEPLWQQAQCAAAAVELRDVGFPGYAQALGLACQPTEGALRLEDILHMHNLLLPEGEGPDKEKAQAVRLVLSAYSAASGLEPLLLIPCVILDMLCISPFPAGSPGVALLLARRLLIDAGFGICRFAPLEQTICRFASCHRQALERSAAHWEENANAYLPYIEAFLCLLYLALRQTERSLPEPKRSKGQMIRELVLRSPDPISKAEICAALPQVSMTTVEAVLGNMVKAGDLRRVGGGRSSRYLRN